MAPKPGADGLLSAAVSKATSTRVILVLVAALSLAAAGCGGGADSGPEGSSSSTATAAQSKQGSAPAADPPAPADSRRGSKPQSAEAGQPGQAKATAGKQGPPIRRPKGPREPAPTPKQRAEATIADISLTSPALGPGLESISTLPAPYTCAGKDTWPTLRWSGIPAGTAELALLVLNVEPVNGALFFDWALTGLDPDLKSIASGQLPKGTIVGRNSFGKVGYSICPPGGKETYLFALYALPRPLAAGKGFDPAALRRQILELSGNSGLMAVSSG